MREHGSSLAAKLESQFSPTLSASTKHEFNQRPKYRMDAKRRLILFVFPLDDVVFSNDARNGTHSQFESVGFAMCVLGRRKQEEEERARAHTRAYSICEVSAAERHSIECMVRMFRAPAKLSFFFSLHCIFADPHQHTQARSSPSQHVRLNTLNISPAGLRLHTTHHLSVCAASSPLELRNRKREMKK